jgi:hypothetical protein
MKNVTLQWQKGDLNSVPLVSQILTKGITTLLARATDWLIFMMHP